MKTLLQFAALLQLSLLVATALVPRVLDWRNTLAALPLFVRQHVWVNGIFIVLTIISFAVLTLFNAEAMAQGDPLARSLCLVIAVFWAARLVVQFFVFDAEPFLTNWFYKTGYHALTVIFILLVAIYTAAALGSARAPRVAFGASPNAFRIECHFDQNIPGEAPETAREARALRGTLRLASEDTK